MDAQRIIALSLVGAAFLYLGRNAVRAFKAYRSGSGGCASGCGKCGFAPKDSANLKSSRPDIIPLSDIKTLPPKRKP